MSSTRYPISYSHKSGEVSFALCLFTGLFGGQRFYAGRIGEGILILILSLLTGGVVGAATMAWDAWKITHDQFKDRHGGQIKFLTPQNKWPKSGLLAFGGFLGIIGASIASGGLAALIIGAGMIATGAALAAVAVKRHVFNKPSQVYPLSREMSSNALLLNRMGENPNYQPAPAPHPTYTQPPAPYFTYNPAYETTTPAYNNHVPAPSVSLRK